MHKLSCLIFLCFCNTILFSQKTDSVHIFYNSDEFDLKNDDQQLLDKFLAAGWDKIIVRSYADVTDEDDHNIDLTRKRATEVNNYLSGKGVYTKNISMEFFGESILLADNATEEGRAKNRRTTIVGFRYARSKAPPVTDPDKPVTQTLQNGVMVTYRPKNVPDELIDQFRSGQGFELITNTREMRNANLFNNTTDGEILSSVMIFSGGLYNPCKLDSPIFINVPVPVTDCPMDSIEFFAAVERGGLRIWEQRTMALVADTIGGQRYMGVWMDDFCGVYNFDYKVRPGKCFDIDSIGLITKHENVKNVTSELIGLNSVYLPRQVTDTEYSIWYVKNKFSNANVTFSLYNGKKVLKRFYAQRMSSFPYSPELNKYMLTTDTIRFASVGVKDFFMLLKVNRDVYRKLPEKNMVEFIYLNRAEENITVNIYATGRKKKQLEFKNVPISLIPFDEASGTYVIDRKLLVKLEQAENERVKDLLSAR